MELICKYYTKAEKTELIYNTLVKKTKDKYSVKLIEEERTKLHIAYRAGGW